MCEINNNFHLNGIFDQFKKSFFSFVFFFNRDKQISKAAHFENRAEEIAYDDRSD